MAKFEEKIAEWMPLRLQIWRKGTAFFSPAERGAYMDLILAYWELGPLPNEDGVLQQLARVNDTKAWRAIRTKVLTKFTEIDGALTHARIDEERTVALQKFKQKSDAGKAGGQASVKAKSKPPSTSASSGRSTVVESEPQSKSNTTYLEHTPDGVAEANASGAKRPKAVKGHRLANDWQPSEQTRDHARTLNLTADETGSVVREFCEYFWGEDATRPVKKDWDGACRRWITRAAPNVVARRARGQQSHGNRPGVGSVFAALSENLEAGDLGGQGHGGNGMGWGDNGDRMDEGFAGSGPAESPSTSGPLIDADYVERVPESAGETEVHDESPQRIDGGHPADTDVLRGGTDEVPGRRGEVRPRDAEEHLALVAGMVGVEGEAGPLHEQTAPADGCLEEWEILPDFLRRS